MPINDKDVADLCIGIYRYPHSPLVRWDRFDDGKDSDQICWGVKIIEGCGARFPWLDDVRGLAARL